MTELGRSLPRALLVAAVFGCSAAPEPLASTPPRPSAVVTAEARPPEPVIDECSEQPGRPPPEPLERTYTGVAARARCQRELSTIMDGVSHSLGVSCTYCHSVPDYRAMTHRKQVANWMATELIPALRKKSDGRAPWCNDCHTEPRRGRGRAKFLGDPRNPAFASEWMTTHLVEDLETKDGAVLRCKNCHRGNLGTPEFRSEVILSDLLAAH